MEKKLQNYFKDFLPQTYFKFRRNTHLLTSNQAVVAELLRICCEEDDVKAIQLAFERILGKPEKVVVIKRTLVRTIFPDAKQKALKPEVNDRVLDEVAVAPITEEKVVVSEADAPGVLLKKMLDDVGSQGREYSYQVLDKKDTHTVAEVLACNLYGIAMRGANLGAIKLLFDYLDGAVADVVRLDGEDTILLESFADIAPYEAVRGADSIWYVETEGVS